MTKNIKNILIILSFFFLVNDVSSQTTLPSNAKILCLGDSRVEGGATYESYRYELWKDLIDCNWNFDFVGTQSDLKSYPNYQGNSFDRHHQGEGGYTTFDVLSVLPSSLSTIGSVDVVLLGIGGNDFLNFGSTGISSAINNINSIIDILQNNNPNVTIFIEQIAPGLTSFMTADFTLAINDFNNLIPLVAINKTTTSSKIVVVDMHTGWQDNYFADVVHYNTIGAEIVASKYMLALENFYNSTTSIDKQLWNNNSFLLYPNPTNSYIYTKINIGTINIYNLTGKLILSKEIDTNTNIVDVSSIFPGSYLVDILDENGNVFREKIIIQ